MNNLSRKLSHFKSFSFVVPLVNLLKSHSNLTFCSPSWQMQRLRHNLPVANAARTSQRRIRTLERLRRVPTAVLPPESTRWFWFFRLRSFQQRCWERRSGETFVNKSLFGGNCEKKKLEREWKKFGKFPLEVNKEAKCVKINDNDDDSGRGLETKAAEKDVRYTWTGSRRLMGPMCIHPTRVT